MTDDERREAAERLREEAAHGEMHTRDFLGALCACIKAERNAYRAILLLADLIDPDDPPYNLYTLYEAVFHRSPRCWECVEDDEVEELIEALLDICNAPGHECIQRPQPSEPEARCVAEVKVDGERLEKLVHDAAVELTGIDRDALLELADRMENMAGMGALLAAHGLAMAAASIREALGANDG